MHMLQMLLKASYAQSVSAGASLLFASITSSKEKKSLQLLALI